MKTVADIMTSAPIVVEVPGKSSDAINVMVKNKLTGLPVVHAETGRLMGIVSRRDVFKKFEEEQLSLVMKKDIITISPDADIRDAARIFVDRRIHRLPVVDDGSLVGIVTPTDLLDAVAAMKTKMTAEEAIRIKCVTAYEEEPLSYTIAAMRISDVAAMPVLDARGKLVGILTDRDLFVDQSPSEADLRRMGMDETMVNYAGYRNVIPLFYVATQEHIPEEHIVRDSMVEDPLSVFKKASLSDVAKIMKEKDFGQIPVHGNRDELIGMIYDVDVLLALLGE
ncbi:MAG: CBS domain-containing protein [Thermoplasmatales archaeon]|nr:CBS domain-containing protein [Thermoplasmatales archaeon]